MKASATIKELATALAKAQSEFGSVERGHTAKVKTRSGGDYEFNYADLASYLSACRVPLANNGLSFLQEAKVNGDLVSVTTLLLHASGESIEAEPFTLKVVGQGEDKTVTPQVIGSGVTYARRYSLSSLIGMASEADDDGNIASGNHAETKKREALPACPACGKTESTIIGKPEFGGGFVCYGKKNNGCGHKWQAGEVPNEPTLPSDAKNADELSALWKKVPKDLHKSSGPEFHRRAAELGLVWVSSKGFVPASDPVKKQREPGQEG
jgi:hypothetical protein